MRGYVQYNNKIHLEPFDSALVLAAPKLIIVIPVMIKVNEKGYHLICSKIEKLVKNVSDGSSQREKKKSRQGYSSISQDTIGRVFVQSKELNNFQIFRTK